MVDADMKEDAPVRGPVSTKADGYGHSHEGTPYAHETPPDSGPRLLFTLALNFIIPVAQVVGGIYAHSVALMSDAAHNFSDCGAILISYVAYRIGRKGPSIHNTFGYRRAEIIAALVNVAILLAASVVIVYEALRRFQHPRPVSGGIVIWLACVGVLGNGLSAWLLHQDSKHSLNVRGAFLHMMGDLLTSVAVLASGVVLLFKPWYRLDPLLSLLIVLFILKSCWSILREAVGVLMNATPKGLDVEKVKGFLERSPEVCGVHYLHAWRVSSTGIAFSCHVVVRDQPVSRTEALGEKLRRELFRRFGIDHPVLQVRNRGMRRRGGRRCESIPVRGIDSSAYRDRFKTGKFSSIKREGGYFSGGAGTALSQTPSPSLSTNRPLCIPAALTARPAFCAPRNCLPALKRLYALLPPRKLSHTPSWFRST